MFTRRQINKDLLRDLRKRITNEKLEWALRYDAELLMNLTDILYNKLLIKLQEERGKHPEAVEWAKAELDEIITKGLRNLFQVDQNVS